MDGESTATDLHDASFAYLTAAQQNYVYKLTESAQVSHPDVTASLVQTNSNLRLERTAKAGEGEISVFGAEQYFNTKLEDRNGEIIEANAGEFMRPAARRRADLLRMRSKGRLGTPSVSSESSWNSQTALLPSTRRNLPPGTHTKKANERWFFPGFSCNGSCLDDKSIDIDENVSQRGHQVSRRPPKFEGRKLSQSRFQAKDGLGKMNIGNPKREDCLVLPTANSGAKSSAIRREKQKTLAVEDPRKSIEVFGTHVINKEDIASNLERKLSVLTWDAIPYSKAQSLPSNSATYEEDPEAESEASSELFEIENISCSTQPIYTKQISDEMSGCMTPTSETSIEWSVVTASAADFSFVSDCDYQKKISGQAFPNSSTPRSRRPNRLLGCTNQKAVDVAETAYKRNEKPTSNFRHQRTSLDSPIPVRRISADHSVVKDFNFS